MNAIFYSVKLKFCEIRFGEKISTNGIIPFRNGNSQTYYERESEFKIPLIPPSGVGLCPHWGAWFVPMYCSAELQGDFQNRR